MSICDFSVDTNAWWDLQKLYPPIYKHGNIYEGIHGDCTEALVTINIRYGVYFFHPVLHPVLHPVFHPVLHKTNKCYI